MWMLSDAQGMVVMLAAVCCTHLHALEKALQALSTQDTSHSIQHTSVLSLNVSVAVHGLHTQPSP